MIRKLFLFVTLGLIFLSNQKINAQIYTNGSLSTGSVTASGFMAPSGYTWSELQNNTGNSTQVNGTSGLPAYFYADGSSSYTLADDFTVPSGEIWQVTSFDFFCYQPVYSGATPPIDNLRIQLYNTNPSIVGSTPIIGDLTTNVYDVANSDNAFIYRIFHSVIPTPQQPNFSRKIFRVRANLTTSLPPGQYWVEFQAHATDNTEIFFPPVTVLGNRSVPNANSKINVIASIFPSDVLGWGTNTDIGIPNSAPDVALAIPFLVNGTSVLDLSENGFELSIQVVSNVIKKEIMISINKYIDFNELQIYDVNSRLIKLITTNNEKNVNISADNFDSGVYFIKIITDKGIFTKKIIL